MRVCDGMHNGMKTDTYTICIYDMIELYVLDLI